MCAIDLGLVLWVLGVLTSGVVSALGWRKGIRYRLLPIPFGISAGVLVILLGMIEGRGIRSLLNPFVGSVVGGGIVWFTVWVELRDKRE